MIYLSLCSHSRTTAPAHHLDGKHVVFGHVIKGSELLLLIEQVPVDSGDGHRPRIPIEIIKCGELKPGESGGGRSAKCKPATVVY